MDTPQLRRTVLDTTDPRGLAEFYRALLGFEYRGGDEPPSGGADDERGRDWLVLNGPGGRLAFQYVETLTASTWPEDGVPQQLHLDLTVPDVGALTAARDRAIDLGAELRLDRSDNVTEPLYVFADPAGHPFCIFVG